MKAVASQNALPLKSPAVPFWGKIKDALWGHKVLASLFVIAAVGGAYYYHAATLPPAPARYVLAPVKKDTLILTVEGTGQVTAVDEVDLKPLSSGVVTSVNVKDGESVKAGQTIAVLDEKSANVSIAQAQANLEEAQANLEKLQAGATAADVATSQASVASAQTNLANAERSLADVTQQQQLNVSNAYHTFLNSGLSNSGVASVGFSANPSPSNISTGLPSISGTYTGTQQGSYTVTLFNAGQMYFQLNGLETGQGSVNTSSPIPLGTEGLYIQFPSGSLYSGDSWTITIPNTRASNYLGNLNAYQNALQSQSQAIDNAEASVSSSQASLAEAQANLTLKQEPAQPEDIATAKAQVDIAQSQVQTAQLGYQNNIVTAPFAGIIASVAAQPGDQASPSAAVATLITKQLYVQVPMDEVDAAKVQAGQKATVTFDAIPDLLLTGNVMDVETLGTVTQGVVSYNVDIALDSTDPRVKPGMSAQAEIVTQVYPDVLTVPNAALNTQGAQQYVEMLDLSTGSTSGTVTVTSSIPPIRRTVQTGASDDTETQITGGLTEGQRVIIQTIGGSAASTASTGLGGLGRLFGGGSAAARPGAGG